MGYSILGVLAAILSFPVSILHKPIIMYAFAELLFLMALANFDLLPIPQVGLNIPVVCANIYLRAILFGIGSLLVCTSCITPALVSILVYIAQTHHIILGGLNLFALGLGLATPLILCILLGVSIISKFKPIMKYVKYVIGIILLVMTWEYIKNAN